MPIVRIERHKEFVALLRKRLSAERARHSVFVAEYLTSFAEALGIDHDQAATAGLLHDLCRGMSDAELLREAHRYGMSISEVQRARPVLLHGPVAAEEIRNVLGVDDEAVHEAVCWHTTGRPKLGRLGCALIVADFAEPARRFPEAARARTLMREEGFDKALHYVAEQRRNFARQQPVADPTTEAFFLWLEKGLA